MSHIQNPRVYIHIHTHIYIRMYTRRIYVHAHTYVCVVNGVIRTHYALRSLHLPYALFIRGAFSVLSFSFSLPLCTSISFCILPEQKISPISSYSFCESSNFFRIMIIFTATKQAKVNRRAIRSFTFCLFILSENLIVENFNTLSKIQLFHVDYCFQVTRPVSLRTNQTRIIRHVRPTAR